MVLCKAILSVISGQVVGSNTRTFNRAEMRRFKGYGESGLDYNIYASLYKTIAFRAELSIFAPHKFGPSRYFSLYYSGMKFSCFVLHVFEDENQSRKIKLPNMEIMGVNGSDKIARQKEAAQGIKRIPRTLLNKATAVIATREGCTLKVATNSPFEKHYDGKVVLMSGKSFVASGKINKVVNDSVQDLDKSNCKSWLFLLLYLVNVFISVTRSVYDKLLSRASELFVLPQEQALYDKFLVHEKNSSHRQRVFCDTKEFHEEKKNRLKARK